MEHLDLTSAPEALELAFAPVIKYLLDRAKVYGVGTKYLPDLAMLCGLSIAFGLYYTTGVGSWLSALLVGTALGWGAIGYNSGGKHRKERNG